MPSLVKQAAVQVGALASRAGRNVSIATNQAGAARGFYPEAAVHELHSFIKSEVRKLGGTVDDIRNCPRHSDRALDPYRIRCDCRKPTRGMIMSLLRTRELNPAHCVLIGDKGIDLKAARRSGMNGVLFEGEDPYAQVQDVMAQHYMAGLSILNAGHDMPAMGRWILSCSDRCSVSSRQGSEPHFPALRFEGSSDVPYQ